MSAFDLNKLYHILARSTIQLRKGDVWSAEQHGPIDVVTIDAMPHEDECPPDRERVDVEFMTIGVDKTEAEKHRNDLVDILNAYPQPDRLAGGPSYIEVGAVVGDQGAAFQLFALGKVLGLWDVVTPTKLGITGPQARDLAGRGMIMITGYHNARHPGS